jgi:hypothetical protein
MTDELPSKPKNYECVIVNLDVSKNIGTHWICYIKDGEQAFVFDSFSSVPPKRLVSYLTVTLNFNNYIIQNFDEVTCGHLCVTLLKMYLSGV